MNNMEESRQKEPEVYKVYEFIRCSELVEKLIDKEQFKPLPFNRAHYLSKVFSTLKNNFKMAAKLAFLKFRTKDESKGLTTFQLSTADCWPIPTGNFFRL